MIGGNFDSFNKVVPGYYQNQKTQSLAVSGLDSGGPVAIALDTLEWGSEEINLITPESDLLALFGKNLGELKPIRESFKGNGRILVYNLAGAGEKAKASTDSLEAEAVKDGAAGNKINVIVSPTPKETLIVSTYFRSELVDKTEVEKEDELDLENDFVKVKGVAPETEVTLDLVGGKTGEVTTGSYAKWLKELAGHNFKTLVPGVNADEDVHILISAQVKMWKEDYGKRVTAVLTGFTQADHETVVASPTETITLENGEKIPPELGKYFYAAVYASTAVDSLTSREYPGAVDVTRRSPEEMRNRLQKGQAVYAYEQGADGIDRITILQDITSFTSFTKEKNQDFAKGKIVRTANLWHDNTKHIWNRYFKGKWSNTPENRSGLVGKIIEAVATPLVNVEAIMPVDATDLEVSQGPKKSDVVLKSAISINDAMEILYENQKLL